MQPMRLCIALPTAMCACAMALWMVFVATSACPVGDWIWPLTGICSISLALGFSWLIVCVVSTTAATNGGSSVRSLTAYMVYAVAVFQGCFPVLYAHSKRFQEVHTCPEPPLLVAEVFVSLGDMMAYTLVMYALLWIWCANFHEMRRMYYEARLCSSMLDLCAAQQYAARSFRRIASGKMDRAGKKKFMENILQGRPSTEHTEASIEDLALYEVYHLISYLCQTSDVADMHKARDLCGLTEAQENNLVKRLQTMSGKHRGREVGEIVIAALQRGHILGSNSQVQGSVAGSPLNLIKGFIGVRQHMIIDIACTTEPLKFTTGSSMALFLAIAAVGILNLLKVDIFRGLGSFIESRALFYFDGVGSLTALTITTCTVFYVALINSELQKHEGLLRRSCTRFLQRAGDAAAPREEWQAAATLAGAYADELAARDYRIKCLGVEVTKANSIALFFSVSLPLAQQAKQFLITRVWPLIFGL